VESRGRPLARSWIRSANVSRGGNVPHTPGIDHGSSTEGMLLGMGNSDGKLPLIAQDSKIEVTRGFVNVARE